MPTYQPLIPTGTVPLNQDYQNLQGNFQVADSVYGVDHYAFSNVASNIGYHKVVHMVAISTVASNPPNNFPIVPPAGAPLAGELFTTQSNIGLASDEILWYQSGGGKLAQMTVNLNPVAKTNGNTFIPGGMILQWGQVTSTASTFQTLTFSTASGTDNIAFPNNCFAVFTQPYGSGTVPGDTATVEIRKSSLSNLSFQWAYVTNSGQYTGFFWWALGN